MRGRVDEELVLVSEGAEDGLYSVCSTTYCYVVVWIEIFMNA